MFLIISNIFKLANLFKNVLFKRIVNPIQSAYLVSLVWEITKSFLFKRGKFFGFINFFV